jgi:phage RecT family recombinase
VSNALTVYETDLNSMTPTFADVLPKGFPVARLIRTVLISLERTPKLLECTKASVMQASTTLAVLGLEADGVTGQGFLIPFAGKAQTVIGYKGYNTLGARARYAIRGGLVLEGDKFDIDYGRAQPIIHKPSLEPVANRKQIGAWALAGSDIAPSIPVFLRQDELLAIKQRSPGARKSDSPWNDPAIGFPAMCEKSAKRRLARSMPLNVFQLGAVMEELHEERGLHSWIDPREGVIHDNVQMTQVQPVEEGQIEGSAEQVTFPINKGSTTVQCQNIEEWVAKMRMAIDSLRDPEKLRRFRELNGPVIADLQGKGFEAQARTVDEAFTMALRSAA